MGQSLPLPERIPLPKGALRDELELAGITFIEGAGKYVNYTLPDGWSLQDQSHRADIPEWFMVDNEGMCRAFIHGTWKDTYDNELHISECERTKYIPREGPSIPSETDGPAIAVGVAVAMAQRNVD